MNWRCGELGWRLWPGSLVALTIAAASWLGAIQPLEQIAYNTLFRLRGESNWDERVVVIAIDEATMRQLKQFPLQRQNYVEVLNVLAQAETGAVVFDVIWAEATLQDDRLVEAIIQHGGVVLPQAWDGTGLPLRPQLKFEQAAAATGHVLKREDADGISRQVTSVINGVPTLSITALHAYALTTAAVNIPSAEPPHPLWVNWARSSRRIPSYSLVDVIQGKVAPAALHRKIVVIGATAAGMDPLVTPFDRNPPSQGVYLQATLINNLLQNNLLQVPSDRWLIVILLVGGPGLSWLLNRWRMTGQIVIACAVCSAWVGFSLSLFHANYWIPVALPLLLVVGTTVTVIITDRLRMNQLLQQQVEQLWQTHQQDIVVAQVGTSESITQTLAHQPKSMRRATQLAALAEQFGRSQSAQAAIARSLSSGLLAADREGLVWFCNPTASQWLAVHVGERLVPQLVPHWLTPEQWQATQQALTQQRPSEVITLARNSRWFELKIEPIIDHQPSYRRSEVNSAPTNAGDFLLLVEEVTQTKQAELALVRLNQQLRERSTQLELVNRELESFSYAVSHDLRAPLRRIDGFSHILLEENIAQLDQTGVAYLNRIRASVQQMGNLIEDLLNLSRIIRTKMTYTDVNLSAMVAEVIQDLQQTQPERIAEFLIVPEVMVHADANLLKIAIENLLNNAWKYTSKRPHTRIEFGIMPVNPTDRFIKTFFIQDNGAGFDNAQADRLFSAFQRLHTAEEFPGNGVGLMTTQRIIHRHHGRIWADGKVDQGATFYFTLGNQTHNATRP
jgi:CHASE2 domain-containing sensor protein/nitrogen-specific signal transduction histidine kinase